MSGHLSGVISELTAAFPSGVRTNIRGCDVTTLKIGGPLKCVVTLSAVEEAVKCVQLLRSCSVKSRALGAGSNVLISDLGIEEPILRLGGEFREVVPLDNGRFRVGGGVSLMSLAREISSMGLSGLEFGGGIPATLGGAIFMNAGAHGNEICEVVDEVQGISPEGDFVTLAGSSISWKYRNSGLESGFLVLGATLRFVSGDRGAIQEKLQHNLSERKKRQPLSLPSAGSVFKNPAPDQTAGALIDKAGLKGHRLGGAQISEMHGNWIVNPDRQSTAEDFKGLVELCKSEVHKSSGIDLHAEVRGWGISL